MDYFIPKCCSHYYAPAFVHLSVTYIVNNSRTQKPSVPKFGMKVLILDVSCIPVLRSKVKVTRPINADTHRAPCIPSGKAYKLQTLSTVGGRRPASATSSMASKVKVARSRDQSEPSWPNAEPVSLESQWHTMSATLLANCGRALCDGDIA